MLKEQYNNKLETNASQFLCDCTSSEQQYKLSQKSQMRASCPTLQIIFHFAAMLFQLTV